MMKRLFFLTMVGLAWISSHGQDANRRSGRYSIIGQYNHEIVLGGYVRVREWELTGDEIRLKDLGITNYPAIRLGIEKHLKKNRSLIITYDHLVITGSATLNRDVHFNGTIINGRNGVDVSPTRYYRITASFTGPLIENSHFDLRYKAALVVDHIKFYIDGDVSPASKRNEVYERFGRQAFPYPVVGLDGQLQLNNKSHFNFEVSGSYIPEFKSFYTEGGSVYLQYSNFLTDVSYSRNISDFVLKAGARFSYMHLSQESTEDTNVISIVTLGPYVGLVYHF